MTRYCVPALPQRFHPEKRWCPDGDESRRSEKHGSGQHARLKAGIAQRGATRQSSPNACGVSYGAVRNIRTPFAVPTAKKAHRESADGRVVSYTESKSMHDINLASSHQTPSENFSDRRMGDQRENRAVAAQGRAECRPSRGAQPESLQAVSARPSLWATSDAPIAACLSRRRDSPMYSALI
eukprot:Polyplicarium_translucidae@DN779_c0_g1_i2.p1